MIRRRLYTIVSDSNLAKSKVRFENIHHAFLGCEINSRIDFDNKLIQLLTVAPVTLENLIQDPIQFGVDNNEFFFLMHYAVDRSNVELVKAILRHEPDVNKDVLTRVTEYIAGMTTQFNDNIEILTLLQQHECKQLKKDSN
jgi:hypothetical protein